MPVQPPSRQELQRIADAVRPHAHRRGARDVRRGGAGPTLAGFARLDELPDEPLPVKYPRADLGHRPTGAENPSQRLELEVLDPGRRRGPARGRARRASRTTSASPASRCSTARRSWRATSRARTRRSSRGCSTPAREIVGKTAVPAFCFDGGGLTGYPDPQPDEPARRRVPVRLVLQRQRRRARHRPGRHGARRRPGRLDPAARVVERLLSATSRRTGSSPTPASSRSS